MALLALLVISSAVNPASAQHAAGDHPPSAARQVSIGFASLTPDRLDLVSGETVQWTNDSARVHTATADDGSFDSGRFGADQTFSHRFGAAGAIAYHCRLHPSIKGVVAVHDLLLDAPTDAAAPNTAFPLTGRASGALAAGTEVSLEGDTGAGFRTVGTATLGSDGAFSARLAAPAAGSYRAVAAGLTSPAVNLLVLDRRISLSARRSGGRTVLRTAVTPAAPGGHVVLQHFLPERFGWWPVRRARLDARSAAAFVVRTKRRLRTRVRLTLADGATPLATSRTLRMGVAPAGYPHRHGEARRSHR